MSNPQFSNDTALAKERVKLTLGSVERHFKGYGKKGAQQPFQIGKSVNCQGKLREL